MSLESVGGAKPTNENNLSDMKKQKQNLSDPNWTQIFLLFIIIYCLCCWFIPPWWFSFYFGFMSIYYNFLLDAYQNFK